MKLENSIGWCDVTGNCVTGCDKVSPGCKNCYAAVGTRARVLRSQGIETWGPKGQRYPVADFSKKVRRLNKLCICDKCHTAQPIEALHAPSALCLADGKCDGTFRRIRFFADSNSDWLDGKWPIETLAALLKDIHDCPNVDFQLLTKRPENFEKRVRAVGNYLTELQNQGRWRSGQHLAPHYCYGWVNQNDSNYPTPTNVWIGVSVEDQKRADERIPLLLRIPAKVRFLSVEPLLSKINLACVGDQVSHPYKYRGNFWELACENHCTWAGFESDLIPDPSQSHNNCREDGVRYVCPECECDSGLVERPDGAPNIDWVIVGGESGKDRRDCGAGAICDVARQCQAAGVPVYVKQDVAFKSGQQGRIPDDIWAMKQFPQTSVNAKGV